MVSEFSITHILITELVLWNDKKFTHLYNLIIVHANNPSYQIILSGLNQLLELLEDSRPTN